MCLRKKVGTLTTWAASTCSSNISATSDASPFTISFCFCLPEHARYLGEGHYSTATLELELNRLTNSCSISCFSHFQQSIIGVSNSESDLYRLFGASAHIPMAILLNYSNDTGEQKLFHEA